MRDASKQKPRHYGLGFWVGISDDDLLSRGIPRTIIGAASFHGPVRYGKAWGQRAMVVREDGGKADLGSAPQHASRSTTLEEVKILGSVSGLPSTSEAPHKGLRL